MIRIERTHTFRAPVDEVFALITGIENWSRYMPNFVGIKESANAHWGRPGDSVTAIMRILGAQRELIMTQQEFEENRLSSYISQQRGLPEMRHERHFSPVANGTEYRWVVTFEPRKGLVGVFDRLVIKRTVTGLFDRTVQNLDTLFASQKQEKS